MKRNSVRILSLFLTLFLFLPLTIPAKAATPPNMDNVDSVCVVNIENNKSVLEKDADKLVYPTATVKLMTALVADKFFDGDYDRKITMTQAMKDDVSGRRFDFLVGEELTVESLLAALLVGGYNDAAVILAHAVSGSMDAFAVEMTQYAVAIGATHTVYKNPTGLHHDEMVTTARDTAIIGMHFMENDVLYSLSKRIKYTLPKTNLSKAYDIYSRNSLISTIHSEDYFYRFAQGLSFGNTDEGGDCVVTSGTLDGLSYVCVVMGGRPASETDETNHAFVVAKNALRFALANFEVMRLRRDNEIVATLPVRYSATVSEVDIRIAEDVYALLPSDINIETDLRFLTEIHAESLDAPFDEGTTVGTLKVFDKSGTMLTEVDLVTKGSADSHGFLVFMEKMKDIVTSPVFIILAIPVIGGIGFCIFRFSAFGRKKMRKRTRFD